MGGPALLEISMYNAAAWGHRCVPPLCKIINVFEMFQTSNLKYLLFSPDQPRPTKINPDQPENVHDPLCNP